jgi:hypothetical protein
MHKQVNVDGSAMSALIPHRPVPLCFGVLGLRHAGKGLNTHPHPFPFLVSVYQDSLRKAG